MTRKPQFLALVRHGQSEANVVTQCTTDSHYYPITGSDKEVALTPQGILDAHNAGLRLSSLFPPQAPIDRMILSPYLRVRQTADEIEKAIGYKPLREENSRLEKRSYGAFWNLTYRGAAELHPEEFSRFQDQGTILYRPPGGENYHDVFDRVQRLVDEELNPYTDNLLLVTHAVVILSIERLFEGLSDEELLRRYEEVALPNGHIQLYSRTEPGAPWVRVPLPSA